MLLKRDSGVLLPVRESYLAPDNRSSPAPPELPEREPEQRFQFSLKQLLLFMFVCAILASGVRYLVQWTEHVPKNQLIGWFNTIHFALGFGALVYFFFRAPYLVHAASRFRRRWDDIQQHRRVMGHWVREHRQDSKRANDS